MKTIKEILTLSTQYLQQKKISHPRRQAEELLCDILGVKRIQLYTDFDRPLTEIELDQCRGYLARRGAGEPLAYIHGSVEFLDCQITVNRDVLIPRQETEILADLIAQEISQWEKGKTLLDLCCGSGCIGIALQKKYPHLKITASDISPKALEVAKANARKNSVQIEFYQGDLFEALKEQRFNGIVCNPPYISENEFVDLDPEVRLYEPKLALVAEENGLLFYQRLANELPAYLSPKGKAWLEIGTTQGEDVLNLFDAKIWKSKELKKDWAGHSRFIFLEIE